jgi:cation diffusion facilitator family transporter
VVDPAIFTAERGIWAVKWSLLGLGATAALQVAVFVLTGSVALLADTIHNFGDALTALPLWAAFALARLRPTKRFTYGFGRVEDLAGLFIVGIILFSAIVAGYQSVERFIHPREIEHVWAVALAGLIGFAGNEAVAMFRIRVGREIGSAALVADGHHARIDGFTSLGVVASAVGLWLGFPYADPLAGTVITALIIRIVWHSGKEVLTRFLEGVDPEVVDEIRQAVGQVEGVRGVSEVRVRWLGHRLHAEVNVTVGESLSVQQGHKIAVEARHWLLHHLAYLSNAIIHVDPANLPGEEHHRVENHAHGDFAEHRHD